jgi:hypothetical protein
LSKAQGPWRHVELAGLHSAVACSAGSQRLPVQEGTRQRWVPYWDEPTTQTQPAMHFLWLQEESW